MMSLRDIIEKASGSSFYLWLLNFGVSRTVPFNAPHHFKITQVEPGFARIELPYRRSNLNHVKGIHACALATLCEMVTGVAMLSKINEKEYRIILKNLKIEYHFQAKKNVTAEFRITDSTLTELILNPLKTTDAVFCEWKIEVFDTDKNHICTGLANWQVKKWNKVKSAV